MSTPVDEVRPIVEGRLYEWGKYASETPEAAISSAYQKDKSKPSQHVSQQEHWVTRWDSNLQPIKTIEAVLNDLAEEQRRLVELRYKERETWNDVAKSLAVSQRQAFRIRDEALAVFGYAFGLLKKSGQAC